MFHSPHIVSGLEKRRNLRLGFVLLTDCAPVVMARELGLFEKHGLQVSLHRELGWATIRDKVVYGALDAAHALAGMPLAATLGLGSAPCECLTALVLNQHGNAITLSDHLWKAGVRDARTLREAVIRLRQERVPVFGVVSLYSSHHFLLRDWLASGGINPDRDVRIVVVPPAQMPANLKAENLDGFCAGEPWNSIAVSSRAGWIAAVSAELAPGHPEKVLMVRSRFAEDRPEEHLSLVAALLEACVYCGNPANHAQVAAVLSRPQYLGIPASLLARGLSGEMDLGRAGSRLIPDFALFDAPGCHEPSGDKAAWVVQRMRSSGVCPDPSVLTLATGQRVFRLDLYDQAARLCLSARNSSYENELQTEPIHA